MKYCPFCKKPIELHWTYCRNCNKPLITNLDNELNIRDSHDEASFYNNNLEEDYYDINILDDEVTERELSELEDQLAESERLGKNMGDLLLKKASLFYKKRDFPNALKNLELALENFLDEKEFLNTVICHNELGIIHEETGFFDQAIYHFDRALIILEDLEDIQKKVQVLNNLGNVYYLVNDLKSSNKYYQKALDLTEKENLELEAIKTSSNLVEILISLKDYDRVTKILKNNLEFFTKTNDVYGIIQTRIKYGKLYYYLGEEYYDQSYQSFTNVLELVDTIKSQISIFIKKKLEWESFLYLGKLHLLWDNDSEAEHYLLNSLEAIRTFGIRENVKEGIVFETIAKFYSLKGEDDKAIEHYSYSTEIYQKFGDKLKIAEMKYEVAKIFQDYIQDEQKAILSFEEALEIFESLNNAKMAAEILNKLGDIYVSNQMFELASGNFERAKKYYAEIEDEYNKNLVLGKINSLKETEPNR